MCLYLVTSLEVWMCTCVECEIYCHSETLYGNSSKQGKYLRHWNESGWGNKKLA